MNSAIRTLNTIGNGLRLLVSAFPGSYSKQVVDKDSAHIGDYSDETLEEVTNPFGLVLWAAKLALKSRKDTERLYRFKKKMICKILH